MLRFDFKLFCACPRSFIPDKHMVFCPEQLLKVILAHIHYMPDHWQGNAHRYETRDEFAQLFQYKAVSNAAAYEILLCGPNTNILLL